MAAAEALDSTVVGTRYGGRGKRARTELADGTNTNWRDWANLTAGPADLIVERVLADDVASYLRFRAVCSSWRRSTPSPHAHDILDRRFHPRQWIMLPNVFPSHTKRREFLNISTGERIRVDVPELRYQFVFGHTPDGLILLCQKGTGAIRLLNPLTRQLTTLPTATSLRRSRNYSWRSSTRLRKSMESQAFSAGLADNSTLALHFLDYELAVAKPNAECWSHCGLYMYSTLSFENRFYCLTWEGIMVVDSSIVDSQRPHLVVAVKVESDFFRADHYWNLVDNGGELILVCGRNYGAYNPWKYEVYLVDLDAGKMVPMHGLRGRSLFICHSDAGRGRALSVHAGLSSSTNADTIYECRRVRWEGGDRQPRIDAYDLLQEDWIKLDSCACPGSIVDYLSRYVCCSEDNNLVPARSRGSVRPANESLAGARKRKQKRKANPKVTGDD